MEHLLIADREPHAQDVFADPPAELMILAVTRPPVFDLLNLVRLGAASDLVPSGSHPVNSQV